MKKLQNIGLVALLCGVFVACGDDSSTSANDAATSSDSSTLLSSGDALSAEGAAASSCSSTEAIANSSDDGAPASSANEGASSSAVVTSSAAESSVSALPANYDPETGLLTDERDGIVYKTAKIGSQIWMGENLKYLDKNDTVSCYLWDDEISDSIVNQYGRHYSWMIATQLPCDYTVILSFSGDDPIIKTPYQGVCPKGWHVPTRDDWQTMFNVAPLQSILSTEWVAARDGYDGIDSYGFTLRLGREEVEDYQEFVILDEKAANKNYTVAIYHDENPVHLENAYKSRPEAYLRCLMD